MNEKDENSFWLKKNCLECFMPKCQHTQTCVKETKKAIISCNQFSIQSQAHVVPRQRKMFRNKLSQLV